MYILHSAQRTSIIYNLLSIVLGDADTSSEDSDSSSSSEEDVDGDSDEVVDGSSSDEWC